MTIEYLGLGHCLQDAVKSWLESHVAWFITCLEQVVNGGRAAAYVDHSRHKMVNAPNEIRAAVGSSHIAPRGPRDNGRVRETPCDSLSMLEAKIIDTIGRRKQG